MRSSTDLSVVWAGIHCLGELNGHIKLNASYPVGGGRQRLKVFVSPKTLRIQRRPGFPAEIDGISPSLKFIGDTYLFSLNILGGNKEKQTSEYSMIG